MTPRSHLRRAPPVREDPWLAATGTAFGLAVIDIAIGLWVLIGVLLTAALVLHSLVAWGIANLLPADFSQEAAALFWDLTAPFNGYRRMSMVYVLLFFLIELWVAGRVRRKALLDL